MNAILDRKWSQAEIKIPEVCTLAIGLVNVIKLSMGGGHVYKQNNVVQQSSPVISFNC